MQNVWRRGEVHTGFLEGKPQGKRPLGRPSRKWEDNIKGTGCMDRIDLAPNMDRWRATVNAVMNLRVT